MEKPTIKKILLLYFETKNNQFVDKDTNPS